MTKAVERDKKMVEHAYGQGYLQGRAKANESLQEENRKLRSMCKKYLSWLNVTNPEDALEKDLTNHEMWELEDAKADTGSASPAG